MNGRPCVHENLPTRQQRALNEGPRGFAADGGEEAGTWLRASSPTSAAGASSSSGA